MEKIKVKDYRKVPSGFTGIVENENGTVAYFLKGLLHRTDGPAVTWFNGTTICFINGKQLNTQKEFILELQRFNGGKT